MSETDRQETVALLQQPASPELTEKLFKLFLRREDMAAFLADFRDFEAFFGKPNVEDSFDWTQFQGDVEAFKEELEECRKAGIAIEKYKQRKNKASTPEEDEEKTRQEMLRNQSFSLEMKSMFKGKEDEQDTDSGNAAGAGGDLSDEEETTVDEHGNTIKRKASIKLDDPTTLTDAQGRVWTGYILDTDVTQTTMPGNRVISHRALVVIGNLKGSAGFGMGKGKNVDQAINAAFR